MKLRLREKTLDLTSPCLMGVLNVTPDSFSDGGQYVRVKDGLAHAQRMIKDGAKIVDIGGESTRPGSVPVSPEEELERLLPIVQGLKGKKAILSIDTYKPQVAKACLEEGAHLINDIYGLRNPKLIRVIADHRAGAVIMHMQGTPSTMQEKPAYKNVVREIKSFLQRQAVRAKKAGIESILVDPGIGFGKNLAHNLTLLSRLEEFQFGHPVVVGVSRKSFIGKITGDPVNDRLVGSMAAVSASVMNGANVLRVHSVPAARRAVQVAWAIKNAKS